MCKNFTPQVGHDPLTRVLNKIKLGKLANKGDKKYGDIRHRNIVQAFIVKSDCEEILFNATIKAKERWSESFEIPMAA